MRAEPAPGCQITDLARHGTTLAFSSAASVGDWEQHPVDNVLELTQVPAQRRCASHVALSCSTVSPSDVMNRNQQHLVEQAHDLMPFGSVW